MSQFKLLLFFTILGWFPKTAFGQETNLQISGFVLNAQNQLSIPYATVYNKTNQTGTITNDDGYFELTHLSVNDTLIFSFVGYEKLSVVVSKSLLNHTFSLKPKTEILGEFVITANNSYLYNMVARCSKNHKTKPRIAKTYFSLESHVNGQQVEMVESYYNGTFSNADVQKLSLKQGRIALQPFGSTLFVSTETSKALNMHHLFTENQHFPKSPLELSKKKLNQLYKLTVSTKYLNDQLNPIYAISFTPRKENHTLFEGQVWIDSTQAQVVKIELQILNAKTHPFLPLGNVDSLKSVELYISKTYQPQNGKMYVKSIDFNYHVEYVTHQENRVLVSTKAVLFAYDYTQQFQLPYFQFTSSRYEDYQKINATPYNEFFWENINEFGMVAVKDANKNFVENLAKLTNEALFLGNDFLKNGLFEKPYVSWSVKRISLKTTHPETTFYKSQLGSAPTEKYKLTAQIYCDINYLNDSLNVITSTVFDPFESFYYYEMDNYGTAFINMYFDLVEIYRIDFMEFVQNENNRATAANLFLKTQEELEVAQKQFFKDVQHGTSQEGMRTWNQYIFEKLKIDNLEYFGVYDLGK